MEPLIFVIGVLVGSTAHQKGLRVGDQVRYVCVCLYVAHVCICTWACVSVFVLVCNYLVCCLQQCATHL